MRLHVDATHALGKLYFDLDDLGADMITFNGSQLYAPKGIGGLFARHGVTLYPLISGGSEQGGARGGDLDVASLVALGECLKELQSSCDYICTETARLRNRLEEGVLESYPDAVVLFQDLERVPTTSAIAFPGIASELFLYHLNQRGVYANIGGGESQQISHVLRASHVEDSLANAAISFCLSRETTEEQIERAINIIVETAKKLRLSSKHII